MNGPSVPTGFRFERLAKHHPRKAFSCGQPEVDAWLRNKALQHQEKRLSSTTALLDAADRIAGYFTLATGQVDFGDLPDSLTRKMPKRLLPVAILAWLGVARESSGQGLGRLLIGRALFDCYEAGQTFAFIAVILDCIDDATKGFYKKFDFAELPSNPNRLYLPFETLDEMVSGKRK